MQKDIHKMSIVACENIKMNQRDMFQEIGITKEIDQLGRILIPKDIRERLALEDSVELILTTEDLLIRNPNMH